MPAQTLTVFGGAADEADEADEDEQERDPQFAVAIDALDGVSVCPFTSFQLSTPQRRVGVHLYSNISIHVTPVHFSTSLHPIPAFHFT